MINKAFICGSSGPKLTDEEFDFFRQEKPCGYILFQRNCISQDQVISLVQSVKAAVETDELFVLVDQEGGRVARLAPPKWPEFPRAYNFGILYQDNPDFALKATRLASHFLARQLHKLGITVNCVPVLDVPVKGAHEIIGDRAYGSNPDDIIHLGRAVVAGHLDGGVLPVIKHIPGHGRANVDSHVSLPTVHASRDELEASDFAPFKALKDVVLGMTGHLLIPALDAHESVSTSPYIIEQIIRHSIGFDGVLMSDDISMGALKGSIAERTKAVLRAGCDLALHCNGDFEEMKAVAQEAPVLSGKSAKRVQMAFAALQLPKPIDEDEAELIISQVLKMDDTQKA